jgi:hypothetical protein
MPVLGRLVVIVTRGRLQQLIWQKQSLLTSGTLTMSSR